MEEQVITVRPRTEQSRLSTILSQNSALENLQCTTALRPSWWTGGTLPARQSDPPESESRNLACWHVSEGGALYSMPLWRTCRVHIAAYVWATGVPASDWPWYNRNGRLGVKHRVTYSCLTERQRSHLPSNGGEGIAFDCTKVHLCLASITVDVLSVRSPTSTARHF